jgi:hypothetical protein
LGSGRHRPIRLSEVAVVARVESEAYDNTVYAVWTVIESVELDGPGILGPGHKRNQLRLEVGVVFQTPLPAHEAWPPDKPMSALYAPATRKIEDPVHAT